MSFLRQFFYLICKKNIVKPEPNIRRFAIGDIHGCSRTFDKLLEKIDLTKSDELYILGDMINRGLSSDKVLDKIIELQDNGYNIYTIRGNHEQLILNLVDETPEIRNKYLRYYKSKNLLNKKEKIKKSYLKIIETTNLYLENDSSIFVHAALDLSRDDIFSNKDFMLYSRYQRGNIKNLNGKRLFHGHVATDIKTIRKTIEQQASIIGIDNGCIYGTQRKGFGRLLCINTDSLELYSAKNID